MRLRNFVVSMALIFAGAYGLLETGYRLGTAFPPYEAEAQVASTLSGGAVGFAYDHEAISVTSGAQIGFTASKINPTNSTSAKMIEITVETANIRYRYDGLAAVTTTTGHQIVAGQQRFVIGINNINRFRMIAESGTATVRATYLH